MDDFAAQVAPGSNRGPEAPPASESAGKSICEAAGSGVLILRDADDLRTLSRPDLLYLRQPLAIRLPQIPAAEAEEVGSRLNRARAECGCSLGAKCMVAGAAAATALLAARYGISTGAFLCRLPLVLLSAFVFAGAGKAAGIFGARRRLRHELGSLLDNLHRLS